MRPSLSLLSASLLTLVLALQPAQAGWQDMLRGVLDKATGKDSADSGGEADSLTSVLTSEETIEGLKEALEQGVQRAVELLGRDGGFLNDPQVRIPMPESLNSVARTLRKLGQDRLADEFETTMNNAAEDSMQEAVAIFKDGIRDMSFDDARQILKGPDNAATEYFRKTSGQRLNDSMKPIIQKATDKAGVTGSYKKLIDSVGFLGSFMDTQSMDLDQYVTDQAVDGLFLKVAEEEKRIREDPVARGTDLLKKVFSTAF